MQSPIDIRVSKHDETELPLAPREREFLLLSLPQKSPKMFIAFQNCEKNTSFGKL